MMINSYHEGQTTELVSVLLAFGSNLGDKITNISNALNLLNNSSNLKLIKSSSFYSSEPMGYANQPWFINSAALFTTSLSPSALNSVTKQIEKQLGRIDRGRWHEREIDIDILLYNRHIMKTQMLTIPHKDLHNRLFVLVPAAEIAPDMIHPVFNLSIANLLANCKDILKLNKI